MDGSRGDQYKRGEDSADDEVDGDAPDIDEEVAAEAERFRSLEPSKANPRDGKMAANSGAASPKPNESHPPAQSAMAKAVKEGVEIDGRIVERSGVGSTPAEADNNRPEVSAHIPYDPDYKPREIKKEEIKKEEIKPKEKSIWDCLSCCFPSKSAKVHPEGVAPAPADKKKPSNSKR